MVPKIPAVGSFCVFPAPGFALEFISHRNTTCSVLDFHTCIKKYTIFHRQLPENFNYLLSAARGTIFSSLNCGWSNNMPVEQVFFLFFPFFGRCLPLPASILCTLLLSQMWLSLNSLKHENIAYMWNKKFKKRTNFPYQMLRSIQKCLKNANSYYFTPVLFLSLSFVSYYIST